MQTYTHTSINSHIAYISIHIYRGTMNSTLQMFLAFTGEFRRWEHQNDDDEVHGIGVSAREHRVRG